MGTAIRTLTVAAFLAAPAAAQVDVPPDWEAIPPGFAVGDSFRLLFLSSTSRDAAATDIATYNTFVQDRAAAGRAAIRLYSSQFTAVGSTAAVDARDNTSTTGTGVPIYWLKGNKVADDYADFYDGSWDDEARPTNELGAVASTDQPIWTGSADDGTEAFDGSTSRALGAPIVVSGHLNFPTAEDNPLHARSTSAASSRRQFYALSPVFRVTGTVPFDSELIPPGFDEGDTFRVLFLSSTERDATSTDIADYNTFIQDRAAAGHADLAGGIAAGFRVVGCTEDVDARDNTSTTYTAADKGVPIYWLAGNKVADDYEDFYDRTWDDEANDKNESGQNGPDTSRGVYTGCLDDGTEAILGVGPTASYFALGRSRAGVGLPDDDGSNRGPLHSRAAIASSLTRSFYGLSPVLTVGEDPAVLLRADLTVGVSGHLVGFDHLFSFGSLTDRTYDYFGGSFVIAWLDIDTRDGNKLHYGDTRGEDLTRLNARAERDLALYLDETEFRFRDSTHRGDTIRGRFWERSRLSWERGQVVKVRIKALDGPPLPASGHAVNPAGTTLTLMFDEALAGASAELPATSAFTVTADVSAVPVTAVRVGSGGSNKTLVLNLGTLIERDETVTVSYADPTTGDDAAAIQDAAGHDVRSFSNLSVTNGSIADFTPPVPTATGTIVPPDGRSIVLAFHEKLEDDAALAAPTSAFVVAVDGTAVPVASVAVFGANSDVLLRLSDSIKALQTVTVTYADPTVGNDANAIQDEAGNDAASFSDFSVQNNSTVPSAIPGAPTGLRATAIGKNRIELEWTAPANHLEDVISGYRIEVSTNAGASWSPLVADTGSTATTYSHTGLEAETTRHYRVSAINALGTGSPSDTARATTHAVEPPDAPTGLRAKPNGMHQIDLTWTAPGSDSDGVIVGYRVEWADPGGLWYDLTSDTGSTATTYSDTRLDPNTTRRYRVSAINAAGPGPPSDIAEATSAYPDALEVPWNWELIPDGLAAGDSFRLIFLSTQMRTASANQIGVYNAWIRTQASRGLAAIGEYASYFRAVGSTADTDARDNTETTYTSDDKGVPIYWLDGFKVADNYEDFYDGSWDYEDFHYNEYGEPGDRNFVFLDPDINCTGSNRNGTEAIASEGFAEGQSLGLGGKFVTGGFLDISLRSATPLSSDVIKLSSTTCSFYGLSGVFTIARRQVEVPPDWELIPSGLGEGDSFRLLFLSSTRRALSSTDIADYNTFVRNRAAAGHEAIRPYRNSFTAVGSTADTDARKNTETTYSTAYEGVPIYWLNGGKVADDYEDFYDGSWDDEANPKDETGGEGLDTSAESNHPGTGSDHDGTEKFDGDGDSLALGSSRVTVGRPNSGGDSQGPLSSLNHRPASVARPMYALSPIFTVRPPLELDVPSNSDLVPSGPGPGQAFRLLFVSSTTRDATSTDIADYNSFIQNRAAAGHDAMRPYGNRFTAVGSTADTDARDNTDTTHTSSDRGVPIYWFNGNKVADDYADFYDGSWDDILNPTTEGGHGISERVVWTGTNANGTEAIAGGQSRALGRQVVSRGTVGSSHKNPFSSGTDFRSQTRSLYGLSPVFRVIASVPDAITDLAATGSLPTRIDLAWTAPYSNGPAISGYKIEVSPDGLANWSELVANTGSTATSYSHRGLAPRSSRHYRVSAINSLGTGPASNIDDATTPFPMLSVSFGASAYTATEGGTASVVVQLSQAPLREVAVAVTATNHGGAVDEDYSGVPVTLTFGAAEISKTITVTATDDLDQDYGESVQLAFDTLPTGVSAGSQATATVTLVDNDATLPSAPTDLAASADGSSQIDLAWSVPESAGGGAISGYRIEVSTDAGATWAELEADTASTGTAYTHTGLSAGAYRHYRVSAINAAGTGPASAVAGATTPVDFDASSDLVPSGLFAGDSFRLLFLSSAQRNAVPTDIADYNTFVQGRAAAGHADLQTHSALFRAVGCTADTDARDNTLTTGTGVPIYWLNGLRVAADHADFYDGEWDNETHADDRDESGVNRINGSWDAFTGCQDDGTEAFTLGNRGDSRALGADSVVFGRLDDATGNPLHGGGSTGSDNEGKFYGLSPVLTVVTPTAPDAITDLAASASGPTQIDLAWTAPDANGAAISGYRIEVSPDGEANWSNLVSDTAGTATTYSHTGLAPGASRHYRVSAINSVGTGPASNVDDATTPFPMLSVSFGASAYTAAEGGAAATVTVTLSGMPLRRVAIPVTATNQGETVDADYSGVPVTLTFGAAETSKTFTVTATDDSDQDRGESVQLGFGMTLPAGVSAGSQATATLNIEDNDSTVPGAPIGLSGSADDSTRIDLAWSVPGFDGDTPITGYRIEVSTDVGANWSDLVANTGSTDTAYSHTGLTAGAYRHYRVSAINAVGTGPASAVAGAITPLDFVASSDLVPSDLSAGDSFRMLFVSSTTRDATLTDIADYNTFVQDRAAAGHADIQAHSALFRAVGCTADTDARDNTITTYTATDNGVPIYWLGGNRVADDFEDFYDGSWANGANDTSESGTEGTETTLVVFTGCTDDGTEAFDEIETTTSLALGQPRVRPGYPGRSDSGPLSFSQSHADGSVASPFYGLSPVFTVVAAVPDAITDLAATATGTTQIDLAWTAPDANGAAISGYRIEVSPDGSSDWTELVADTSSADTSYSHMGVAPGASRLYRVSAINAAGTGPASNVDGATTPYPMFFVSFGTSAYTATEGGTPATVTVTLSGMPLREVEIEVTATKQGATSDADYSGVPVTLTFGAAETSKTFTVTAEVDTDDDAGESVRLEFGTPLPAGIQWRGFAVTTVTLAETTASLPGAPRRLAASADGSTQIDLAWSAPGSDGGAAVSGYRIEVSTDAGVNWSDLVTNTTSTRLSYTHTGLTAGAYRHYRVSAINAAATGPASAVAGATTPVDFGASSELVPSGLSARHSFRLLFLSSTRRNAVPTEIADYNAFVQERAAAGHADIQAHSALFRVLGCTADTDARDNTATTGPGVPIYWLGGDQIADDYEGFYDGEWDDEVNDRNESGTDGPDTSMIVGHPFTGCDHDGTEAFVSGDSAALGVAAPVRVGRPASALSGDGPIGSNQRTEPSGTRPFYGLSPVFTVIAAAPDAITDLAASASGPTQIDLAWTAPNANSAAISGYKIEASPDGSGDWTELEADTASTDTSYSHTGLLPGATRHYRVSAINSVGTGLASNVDDATTPYPMLSVMFGASTYTATEGGTDASVTVTLSGMPLREVEIEVTAANQGDTADADYSGVPLTLTFGAAETSKTFTVTATDDSDDDDGESVQLGFGTLPAGVTEGSPASATVSLVDNDAPVLGAPTGLAASANGSTQIDLAWSAPGSDGGSAITGYRIEVSADVGATWSDFVADTASTGTAFSHGGLTAGAYRHYRVSAINSGGTGPASAVAGATTPVGFGTTSELVPSGLSIGDSFRLLFLSSTNRDATSTDIADYNSFVQERAAAGHADVQAHSALFRALGCTADTDARDNTATTGTGVPIYWLNGPIAAADHAGFYDGEWDNETNADDRDESGANSVDTGVLKPFTGCNDDGTEVFTFGMTGNSHALGAEAVGLGSLGDPSGDPLRSFSFGPPSTVLPIYGLSPVFTVIATAPDAITDLAASASGPTQIDLTWTAPAANGAAISGYRIEVSPDGSSNWTDLVADTSSTNTSYSHTGLAPGASRHYRVSAINSAGTGPASNVDDATTTAFPMLIVQFGAPTYTATEGGAAASVTVTLSGMPLRQVEIPVTATNQGETADADYSGVPLTLTFGASETSKTFTVTATVDSDDDHGETVQLGFDTLPAGITAGSQATATVTLAETAAVVPGTPTDLAASADGSTQIDLAWSAPGSDGGAAISGYRIEVSTDVGANWSDLVADTASTDTAYTHTGLTAGAYRHYRVSAINAAGTGPASAVAGATTPVDFGASSELAPAGLSVGDSFRLLFLSSTRRNAEPADIADYNTFIQDRAAAGHADIQAYSALFRALGCTVDTDARDNTVTTYTASAKGLPVYWLGGDQVADDYEGFYDGEWDDEANDRNESGTDGPDTSQAANYPFTGCAHDGTEAFHAGDSLALGVAGLVRVGRPASAISGDGPIGSNQRTESSGTRPFYGLSPVFTVIATVPDAITDLMASASGPTQIDLAWTAPDANGAAISGYRVEVSPNGSSDWTELVADTSSTDTSYSHTGLAPGASRHYRVSAINSAGTGPVSNVDDATTPYLMLSVSFGAASYDATEGGTAASVVVQLNPAAGRVVAIEVTATNQGTTSNNDYTGVPVTLTFGASETSKTFTVTATDDSADDDGESVRLGFGTPLPAGVSAGSRASATVNLVDNDLPNVTVSFGADSYTATEGGRDAMVTVRLDEQPQRELAIPINSTARDGASAADYSGVPLAVTFGPSARAVTFAVTAEDDDDIESPESVLLEFGMLPDGVSAGSRASATVRLQDDDGAVPGSVRDLAASPGDGQVTLSWRVPASVGASPISGYAYRYRVPAGLFTRWTETGSTDTSVVVEPLASGQEYIFQVRARNEQGWSFREVQVSVTLGRSGGGICDRTLEVQEAILDRLPGISRCEDVTASHLAGIDGELDVSERGIRGLARQDFEGLVRVEVLGLGGNWLYALPAGLFRPLAGLRELDLTWNLLPTGSIPYDELEALPRLRRIHIVGVEANKPRATIQPRELALRPGGTGRYGVRLDSEPAPDGDGVTIRVESDSANVTVSPASLRFDYENWWKRQEVRVRAGPAEGTAVLTNRLEGFDSWLPSEVEQPADVAVRVGGSEPAGAPGGTPARLVLWTDRLGYAAGEEMALHVSREPMGDGRAYVTLYYRENVGTGQREYFAPETGSTALGPARVDQWGDLAGAMRARPLEPGRRLGAWTGAAPGAGLWVFVAELREPGLERVVKRAQARFVVTASEPEVVGAGVAEVEITGQVRWSRDTIYRLRGPLRVRAGGTLTIEAGTLVEARGSEARIEVDPGGRLLARGSEKAPVVLTCEGPLGSREPGCWGGLQVRGPPPAGAGPGGALTYVRVEFAGGGQPAAAVVLEELGASFAVEGLQAHASAGNGIEFRGGSAGCFYCAASEAGGTGLAWGAGWSGIAQHVYVQQGARGLAAAGDAAGPARPGPGPVLSNATMVGAGRPASAGLRLRSGTAVTARNVVIAGFGGRALDVGGAALDRLLAGAGRVEGLVLHANRQGAGGLPLPVRAVEAELLAHNLREEGNPDPRPRSGSAALASGVAAAETDPRAILDGDHAGGFGTRNWLEGWTFFGSEEAYDTRPPN